MISWFRGQSLRRRTAVSVGLFTTLVVLIFGATSWFLVGRSLTSATDADLSATADAIMTIGSDRIANGGNPFDDDSAGFPGSDAVDTSTSEGRPSIPLIQVLDGAGIKVFGDLPISDDALRVALGEAEESIESVEIGDRTIRILTVHLDIEDGGALQVGTDITNTISGLRQARATTGLAGLLAGIGTAAMAWVLSRHLIAPVTAVAEAADRVRRDHELPELLEGEGTDELGRLVTSFNAMLDDVRHSREQQRRLVADASHELRTPLASLRVKIEFVQSVPNLDSWERQRLLDGAVADLESLSDLVSELVELAADGANQERPRLTDLAEVVFAEVERFRATSGRTVELATEPGLVETRPKQTIRALNNLLVNAHKYSPDGQPIIVHQDGPRLEVRDHGPGIPASERARVFDRFYRGPTHQSVEGSGLGLAIVESVANANGGEVWITEPDDGGHGAVVGFSVGPSIDG